MIAALLLFCGAVAWGSHQPYTFLHGDGAFYANTNRSLWNDFSLDQGSYHPRSWLEDDLSWNKNLDQGWSNVSLGRDGRWLPKHSIVLPMFATPFYALFGLNGLLVFHVLMMVSFLFFAWKVASRFAPPAVAAAATLLMAAQPIVSGDIYAYNNDVFYSAFLMAGAWAFYSDRLRWSGLLFGIAVWAKLTNVLFVLPFGVAILWRWDLTVLKRALIPFMLPIGVFLLSNLWLYGSPTTTSYDTILVRENGQLTTESVKQRFSEPMKDGLKRVLSHERQGLTKTAPLLLLTILCLPALLFLPGGRGLLGGFIAVGLAFLLMHAKYHYTYSRFFLPVAGLAVAPLAAGLATLTSDRLLTWADMFHPRLRGRWNPLFLLAIVAGFACLMWMRSLLLPDRPDHWTMAGQIEKAHVTLDGKRCDYFNNLHQKFECHGDRGSDFFWGHAMGEQCTFGGVPQPMLWLHPPARGRERRIAWEDVPGSEYFELTYGLAETSRHNNVTLELWLNGVKQSLPAVKKRNLLYRHRIGPGALKKSKNHAELVVKAPPVDWRHLCVDGGPVTRD